ncbi:hypothetical protein C8R47DRAFT_965570, partial [Mycena vitilis]
LNYLVEIDSQGRLRWARNHDLVDTTAGRWKDSGDGTGIVPDEETFQALIRGQSIESTSTRDSSALDDAAMHYTGPPRGKYWLTRALRKRFTLHGIVDRLLRKTVRKGTWVYVAVRRCNNRSLLIIKCPRLGQKLCASWFTCCREANISLFSQYVHWYKEYWNLPAFFLAFWGSCDQCWSYIGERYVSLNC